MEIGNVLYCPQRSSSTGNTSRAKVKSAGFQTTPLPKRFQDTGRRKPNASLLVTVAGVGSGLALTVAGNSAIGNPVLIASFTMLSGLAAKQSARKRSANSARRKPAG